MKKNIISIISSFILLITINAKSQTLNPTFLINTPAAADNFKGGYTLSYTSAGTPWTGALISFGGANNDYDCQISSDYSKNRISFRTKNGDNQIWNPWNELPTILGNNSFQGTLAIGAYQSTSPFSVGNNHGIKLSIGNSAWANTSIIETGYSAQTGDFTDIKAASYGYSNGLIRILRNGNVGVGSNNPLAKLEVYDGSILVRNGLNTDNSSAIMIGQSIKEADLSTFGISVRAITQSGERNTYGMQFFTQESYQYGQTEKLRIQGNGNVGIGTIIPDEKLTVNGKIHAQEVRIDLNSPMTVPDYVFANDYKLKSLQEVEDYVKQNNHLPEIPSAKEIEKNGLMLAEMNMSLLKKIEEMTLYIIEQNKELKKQNNKILVLEEKVMIIESVSK